MAISKQHTTEHAMKVKENVAGNYTSLQTGNVFIVIPYRFQYLNEAVGICGQKFIDIIARPSGFIRLNISWLFHSLHS